MIMKTVQIKAIEPYVPVYVSVMLHIGGSNFCVRGLHPKVLQP